MTSDFSDALRELRRQFTDQLSGRIGAIREQFDQLDGQAWNDGRAEAVHRLVHGLTGSAGTFGMQSLSDASRVLEARLSAMVRAHKQPSEIDWQAARTDLNRLEQLALIRLDNHAPTLKPPTSVPPRIKRSPLVYLVEDDGEQARHLQQVLENDGYRVQAFAAPAEFRAAMAQPNAERPAAVLMDMVFPECDEAGAELIAELGLGKQSVIPVIVASVRDDLPGRLAAFRAGANRYLAKPLEAGRLIDLLDALTGRQPQSPYRVMLVDDDELLLDAHAAVLRAVGMEVRTLSEPLNTLEVVKEFDPDVLLLDVYMPQASGPELAAVLRERDAHLHLPILFLSAETNFQQQLLALNLGGDDFLVKPVQPDHLVAAVTARARRARQSGAVRQRLQTTLYEREREHLALEHHAIVSIADVKGVITYANDKFCEITGYAREEVLGQNHRIIKSDQHKPEFYKEMWRTIASGQVWQGEVCNRRRDGALYWVESTITPFLDSDGKPYQYVSIRTDITHLKATENRLALFGHIFDTTDQAIGISDGAGQIVYLNPAFQRVTGYSQDEMSGKHFSLFLGEETKELQAAFMAAINRGENWTGLLPNRHKSGKQFISSSSIGAIMDERGKPAYLFNILSDYTLELERQRELRESRDKADRANQAKSDFLSNMSHELRTPMNAILGFSQLMEYDAELSSEHQDNVREILKAGHHLLGLINEVLDLAKVESGRIDLSMEPVAVTSVVEECMGLVRTLADKRGIQLNRKGFAGVVVRADRTRLKQALLNLISNAIKYNRERGVITIETICDESGGVRIKVTDSGEGIPAQRLAELFQPFHRLDAETSEIEGTGIGLTITRRIVEMMGGVVDVASEVGVGSSFWIDLPLASMQEAATVVDQEDGGARLLPSTVQSREHLVLYVEDNPANIKLMAQILGKRPHIHLLTAHTPDRGLELAMARRPELILLDVNMPGMDGYQVLKVLRADSRSKHIPVIAVTANAMPSDVERGLAAGFSEYLTKPLDVARFTKVLERMLQGDGERKT